MSEKKVSNLLLLVFSFVLLEYGLCEEPSSEDSSTETSRTPRLDLMDIAKEMIGRSGTNSQVLSLNLTNLVILLLLKGLLFGAAYLGGGEKYGYKGRSEDSPEELVSQQEFLLVASYLMGDTDQDYSCLYRVACQEPSKSKEYIKAAKFLIKGAKIVQDIIPFDNKYEQLVSDMQEAVEFGSKYSSSCSQKYMCESRKHS